MRKTTLLACVMVLGAMASAPAKADFSLVRWNDSHWCQIWDNSVGNQPGPDGAYTIVVTGLPSWELSWAALYAAYTAKACGW